MFDFLVSEAEKNVLWLQIRVDDSAYSVEEVQAHKDLSGDLLDEVERKSFVVVAFEDFEEVDAEDFEDHAEVVAIGTLVEEGVEKVEDVAVVAVVFGFVRLVLLQRFNPLGMIRVAGHFLQDFNLSWL